MPPSEQTLLPIVIETKTLVSTMMAQFESYRKEDRSEKHEMATKLAALESKKLSIVDFEKHKDDDEETHKSFDERVSSLQKVMWMASGAVALIQIIGMGLLVKLVLK